MGMNLGEMEQEAFEDGWEAALVAVRIAVERDGLSGAALLARLADLAGNPPAMEGLDDAR